MFLCAPSSTLFPYTTLFRSAFFDGWNIGNAKLYFELLFWDQAFFLELSSYLNQNKIADRKSTRLNSSHVAISYAVFCLKKKKGAGTRRASDTPAQRMTAGTE